MISVIRNSGEELRHVFYVDGVATNADGAVTIGITKADGTTLVAAGTATTHGTTGQYKYVLAPQANLNLLNVTWTGSFGGVVMSQVDQVEIVGGVYCSISELLAMDGMSGAGATAATLAKWRRTFESIAERYCGVAFVPRFARETLAGRGASNILLGHTYPRTILSGSSTNTSGTVTAFTTTNWRFHDYGELVTDGDILTSSVYGERNLTIEYEHGLDAPPPEIAQACMDYVAAKVLQSTNRKARDLLSETDPAGFGQTWSTPNPAEGRPTGLLDVDAALNNYGRAAPAIA